MGSGLIPLPIVVQEYHRTAGGYDSVQNIAFLFVVFDIGGFFQ